ncbi:MAG: YbjQ family protein [Deltaproteobacteria bacterium]|nr:YbjQ family protein [Deltaproteobacteria bacterium]
MILVNTDFITDQNFQTIDIVKGSMIQTKHIGLDILSIIKSLFGGELYAYSEMINEARATATKRMVQEAEKLGADAVINIRYTSSTVMQGASEILVYGTAVRFI